MSQPKFVIWAPTFSESNGGAIVLHLLCDRLNALGETALIWPSDRALPRLLGNPRRWLSAVRYKLTGRRKKYSCGPFPNRLANRSDLPDSIVVYPEIAAGNPLAARHVVRWLLHKPGYHSGVADYGTDEIYFHMMESFKDGRFPSDRLHLLWINEVYKDREEYGRHGSCYMLRKGAGRPLTHETVDSRLLDGLTPKQIADEFNRRERFYCYDPYTTYAQYAAICGCIPVVVPAPGLRKEEWLPNVEDRFGLAYGVDDIGWAIGTRDKLLQRLKDKRTAEDEMVEAFIRKCKAYAARA